MVNIDLDGIFYVFFKFIYVERDRDNASRVQAEREGDRVSSRLYVAS